MSLVERTAQRLEQLRKAGEQVGGELVYPSTQLPPSGGRSNTVERVARELSKQHEAQPSIDFESIMPIPELNDEEVSYDNLRREPRLRQAPPAANDAARTSRSRMVTVDPKRLAAHGVLTADAVASPLANELRVIKRPLIN